MDLTKYQELTGVTVSAGNTAVVTAQIRRTKNILENMLGFTLDPDSVQTNLYNELGKSQQECACPSVDIGELDPPDAVVGAYRLFRYNVNDEYFHIDPYSTINKVKLVYIRPGSGTQGVTIKTFDEDEIRVHVSRNGIKKYVEHCRDCFCFCNCSDCVQLAVDANWLWSDVTEIPEDLLYVWADMITYYTDCNVNIKSETIGAHSYTKLDRGYPEALPSNLAVIARYTGPYGSAAPTLTV